MFDTAQTNPEDFAMLGSSVDIGATQMLTKSQPHLAVLQFPRIHEEATL